MANQEQVDRLLQGVNDWNTWRDTHPFDKIDLGRADLSHANLSHADLSRADLNNTDLNHAKLFGANLYDAILTHANLTHANLTHAHLVSATLNPANLSGTDLYSADLYSANLSHSNFSSTNLSSANLNHAKLFCTDLSGANLSKASLGRADLSSANLSRANFKETRIGWTIFGNIDLRTVQGLETVIHDNPSTIGTDTILRSKGDIPEIFLRGAGLPDTFIEYARSLAQHPIEYFPCFLSYSSQDKAFVTRLYADLQNNNVRCWFAPEDLKIGDKFRPRIEESIRLYDKLLLVFSEHSINSDWVAYEVEKALDKEPHSKRTVLFPIRIDDTLLTCNTQWAQDIKHTRHIGDFERWKDHDAYQQAFSRLLRDLKAESNS